MFEEKIASVEKMSLLVAAAGLLDTLILHRQQLQCSDVQVCVVPARKLVLKIGIGSSVQIMTWLPKYQGWKGWCREVFWIVCGCDGKQHQLIDGRWNGEW